MSAAAALAAGSAVALAAAPAAAAGGFSAGDVVVYRVGDGSGALSGAGAPVFLDEYSPGGALLASVPLPTTDATGRHALVASGSAGSEGGLTLSADGRYLVATGYDAALGASGLSSSAAATVPRTVARVDGTGAVDTSTALTDFADGNNPRSAVSADGSEFWVGGAAGGVRYATLGASTSTSLTSSTYKNVRQLEIVDGQLYASADPTKASLTVATVGTGLPTSGTQAVANLPFASSPVEPYAYSLLTLGAGSTPDTLYLADNSAGAVVKYGLSGGKWVQQGSVLVSGVTGVTANDANGVVTVYATSSGSAGTSGTLSKITDAGGIGGQLSGGAAVIAQAPANQAFRGVAFAPGTVIGSGGGTAPSTTLPTISTAYSGLPAALGDPTNPTLAVTVGDPGFPAGQLSVTAASSNPAVAPPAGITVGGSGSALTLTVTPAAVGDATITLTVTAPDGTSASTQVQYGVSANLGDPSQRYFSGAGNGSSAIDVGDGYMIVGDDETDTLRLYNETQSGPPTATFDFTGQLPQGTTSVDIEASARSGDLLYWTGSMTNSSSGNAEPARSTLFSAKITGSGANTQLTYVGSYSGLKDDLISWDENDGSGLGANYFGLAASAAGGVDSHDANALDVEGMEFAPDGTTAYLAFRAPLEPTSARDLALVIPVTDIAGLVTGSAPSAAFGAPILMNLGGLGIRDIRKNADGQYLIIAGTPDGSNSSFVLYSWDGNPADPPLATGTALPLEPAGDNQGSWETIVSVPDPLTAGNAVQLLEDNGDTAWYGDTLTSKSGLDQDLQKDLGQVFTYVPGTPLATSTALTVQPTAPTAGQTVTYTAEVTGPAGALGTPTGTVEFTDAAADLPGCSAAALDATGTATCTTTYSAAGGQTVSANYGGDSSFAASASSAAVAVGRATPAVSLSASATALVTAQPVTFTAGVSAPVGNALTPTGTVQFQAGGTDLPGCSAVPLSSTATAQCAVPAGFAPSTQTVTAAYSGDPAFTAGSAAPLAVTVTPAATTTTVTSNANPSPYGSAATVQVKVAPVAPGAGTPTGTVTFTLGTGKQAKVLSCGATTSVQLVAGGASCVVPAQDLASPGGSYPITVSYTGSAGYTASSATLTQQVGPVPTTLTLNTLPSTVTDGQAALLTVGLGDKAGLFIPLSGQVSVTVVSATGKSVPCYGILVPGLGGLCAVLPGALTAAQGPYLVTATFAGNQYFAPSSTTATIKVTAAHH
ncbi:MAG TPA: Ig-like domain-containing protein [Actinocrinis sp.]|nr:Ig-like domain-containing protein [Actinocrinis sp.]